ncbi:MAG TPA: hypothetical protein H9665_00160 [Firmicutes bacterium]|nr:hypothetical protein [Bacillota bacterium]
MNSVEQILWGLCAGLALALIYTFYIKRVQGGLIRRLLAADALTEGSAVGLAALGYKNGVLLRHALREGTPLSAVVQSTPDGRYFIPAEKVELAEKRYGNEGMSMFVMLISILVLFAVALVCVYVFPELIDWFESMFGGGS